jgi:hypothetical protein
MSFITSPGIIVPPLTAGGVAYGTGSQAKVNSAGTAGQYLKSNGAGIPFFNDLGSLGNLNTAVGGGVLVSNVSGVRNTGVGEFVLNGNSTGSFNTGVGCAALFNTISGDFNTAVGINALFSNNTGSNNTAIGNEAGAFITGSNNVVLGGYNGSAAPISGTGSGYIVLSDGTGNVRQTIDPSGNVSFPGGITPRVVVIADATSITVNSDTTDIATQANTQAVGTLTVNAPTGTLINGEKFILRLTSTNVQTFAWNAVFAGSTDIVLPAASSGGGKTDYVGFIYNSTAAKWQMIAKVFGF